MKKFIATCCVLGAGISAAHAQSSVTIYGIVDLATLYTNKVAAASTTNPHGTGSLEQLSSGAIQQSRFGFKGTEDLGGGMSALFVLEGGYNGDTGASANSQVGSTTGTLFGRSSYVGLSGNLGTINLGRRKDYTDIIATDYSSVVDFGILINGVHDNNLDRVGGNRSNNMLIYYSPSMAGLVLNASYGFGESATGTGIGNAYGFGANYKNGGFGLGFAYWTSKIGATQFSESDQSLNTLCTSAPGTFGAAGTTCVKTFNIGTSYTTGPYRFYGMFSRTRQPNAIAATDAPNFNSTFTSAANTGAFAAAGYNNSQTDVIDLGADYNLTPALKLVSSFLRSRETFVAAANKGTINQLNLGLDYAFSKRTDGYLIGAMQRTTDMYSPGLTSAPGANNAQFVVMTGLRTTF